MRADSYFSLSHTSPSSQERQAIYNGMLALHSYSLFSVITYCLDHVLGGFLALLLSPLRKIPHRLA